MKRLLSFLAVSVLLLSLYACGQNEPKWQGYTGTMDGYEFCYSQGRERLWEEDILYLADTFLSRHPTVMDKEFLFWSGEDLTVDGNWVRSKELFREDIRTDFLEAVNALIPKLSELEDYEISCELTRIVALIGDGHSNCTTFTYEILPVYFEPVSEADRDSLCAAVVPAGLEHLLGGRLTAVNDMPVEEIVERLTPYVASENAYWPIRRIASIRYAGLIQNKTALAGIGAAEYDSEFVDLTFETAEGMVTESVAFVPWDRAAETACMKHSMLTVETVRFHQEDAYWYEVLETKNGPAIYVRFHTMQYDDQMLRSVMNGVTKLLREAKEPVKLILDLRGNGGGYSMDNDYATFSENVNRSGAAETYVLIDSGVFSAAVDATNVFARSIEGVKLVGTPTGQSGRSFGNYVKFVTPNYAREFTVSSSYYRVGPDVDAIYPDITVYQTWEDYRNGIDTVLEYVLAIE